jgi:hypothetical protein
MQRCTSDPIFSDNASRYVEIVKRKELESERADLAKKARSEQNRYFSPIISSLLPQEFPSTVTAYFETEKEGWENVSNSVLTIKPELLHVGEARHPPTRASVSPSFFCLNLSLQATSPPVWRRF